MWLRRAEANAGTRCIKLTREKTLKSVVHEIALKFLCFSQLCNARAFLMAGITTGPSEACTRVKFPLSAPFFSKFRVFPPPPSVYFPTPLSSANTTLSPASYSLPASASLPHAPSPLKEPCGSGCGEKGSYTQRTSLSHGLLS